MIFCILIYPETGKDDIEHKGYGGYDGRYINNHTLYLVPVFFVLAFRGLYHIINNMIVFYTSTFGFFLLILSDYIQAKVGKRGTRLLSASGYAVIFLILIYILVDSPGFIVYPLSTSLGYVLSFLFSGLLVYSVMIEIPLYKKKCNLKGDEALMKGTYGFCRHPGFIWFLLLMPSLYLVHRNVLYATVSLYMTFLDFILILVEDKFFFPRIFSNYSEYRAKVPFLIPLPVLNRE